MVEGDLFTQVRRTMDLAYTKYTRVLFSYDGIRRVETFPVPQEALFEGVINAVVHRDYAALAPIQISVYDDRISIWNPGSLPDGWSVENLTGRHSSRPHNRGISSAFYRAGMIGAWGLGVRRIVDACEEAGNPPPEWKVDVGGGLRLDFPYSTAYMAADVRLRVVGGRLADDRETARKRQEDATTPTTTPVTTRERGRWEVTGK